MEQDQDMQEHLLKLGQNARTVGLVSTAATVMLALLNPGQFFQSYLQAFMFWVTIPLGGLAFVMIHHLTGGSWGQVSRRIFEAAARTIPLMAAFFLPIVLGMGRIYHHWMHPGGPHQDIVELKTAWLNPTRWLISAAIYFAVWSLLAWLMTSWSRRQDENGDPLLSIRMRKLSGIGLLIWALTVTFASWDWTMSLEPTWYSSMWGPLMFSQCGLTTLAFVLVLLGLIHPFKPIADVAEPKAFHDLGNLTFAFVILWTYMTFSSFLIIWSGNLPEGIAWYQMRDTNGWKWVAVLLALFHFVLPFFLLLSRYTKLRVAFLARIALFILLIRPLDIFWIVAPHFHEGVRVTMLDFSCLLAVGGLWLWVFTRILGQASLVVLHDPRFPFETAALNAEETHD